MPDRRAQTPQRFQSTPHLISGANQHCLTGALTHARDVSIHAPPHQRGEPGIALVCGVGITMVSIHAPPHQRGERSEPVAAAHSHVSIHAPPHQRGERCDGLGTYASSNVEFQSTPHLISGANAIGSYSSYCKASFNPRPTSSAGRTAGSRTILTTCITCFNPRPTSSAGRTPGGGVGMLARLGGFNPRPTSSAGRTRMRSIAVMLDQACSVSIHAPPHQRGERLWCQAVMLPGLRVPNARTSVLAAEKS